MPRTLGTLTIGQAPRTDVTPIIDRYVPEAVRRLHRGLLDGLAPAEIAARFAAQPGEPILVTRLLDGRSVELSAKKAEAAVAGEIECLERDGCDVIVLLCTGTFRNLACARAWLVEPDQVIPPVAAALLRRRLLGIVVPAPSQMQSEAGKWRALERPPIFASASPYADGLEALRTAGADLARRGAEALLLDCIGFTERHRDALADATGRPVILSNAVVAKTLGELLAGRPVSREALAAGAGAGRQRAQRGGGG